VPDIYTAVEKFYAGQITLLCPDQFCCGKLRARNLLPDNPMKNDFEEKMADIMIGEAVTALLDEDVAISWAVLTDRLRAAIEHETDEDRVRAGLRAIEEVRREMHIRAGEKTGFASADDLSSQKLH